MATSFLKNGSRWGGDGAERLTTDSGDMTEPD